MFISTQNLTTEDARPRRARAARRAAAHCATAAPHDVASIRRLGVAPIKRLASRAVLCLLVAFGGARLVARAQQAATPAAVPVTTATAPQIRRPVETQPRPPRRVAQTPRRIAGAPRRPVAVQRQSAGVHRQVVAVVHRLRGWKLRALVAPPDAPIAATFDDNFVRTNIVAGYVLPDGRSVVARLPRAEAEMLGLPALYAGAGLAPGGEESTFVLVKQDGESVAAKFVGFDAGTGLSLLEAEGPIRASAPEPRAPSPAVGQRVRVIAPLPAEAAAAAAARPEPEPTPAADAPDGPVGETGVLYMSLGEVEGRLTEVRRSPTGRTAAITLEVERVSPEWAGAVALSDAGALVGIVEQSGGRETRLLSAESVRAAAGRLQARRASVPQAWLGARGDAVANSKPEFFVARGWPREQAWDLIGRQQGVVLTAVAPGTPASRAGLRPGDVVSRIESHEVRSVEDMSWILREVGGNRRAEFIVLRAHSSPVRLQVQLSESPNPAFQTAQAEARAAETEIQLADSTIRRLNESIRRADENLVALSETIREADRAASRGDRAARARSQEAAERAASLRRQLEENQAKLREVMASFALSNARLGEASELLSAQGAGRAGLPVRPLLPFGIEAMNVEMTNRVNGVATTLKGLMIFSVLPGGAAERAGLRRGDVIETINGEEPSGRDWLQRLASEPGRDATLAVTREGKRINVTLKRPER